VNAFTPEGLPLRHQHGPNRVLAASAALEVFGERCCRGGHAMAARLALNFFQTKHAGKNRTSVG